MRNPAERELHHWPGLADNTIPARVELITLAGGGFI